MPGRPQVDSPAQAKTKAWLPTPTGARTPRRWEPTGVGAATQNPSSPRDSALGGPLDMSSFPAAPPPRQPVPSLPPGTPAAGLPYGLSNPAPNNPYAVRPRTATPNLWGGGGFDNEVGPEYGSQAPASFPAFSAMNAERDQMTSQTPYTNYGQSFPGSTGDTGNAGSLGQPPAGMPSAIGGSGGPMRTDPGRQAGMPEEQALHLAALWYGYQFGIPAGQAMQAMLNDKDPSINSYIQSAMGMAKAGQLDWLANGTPPPWAPKPDVSYSGLPSGGPPSAGTPSAGVPSISSPQATGNSAPWSLRNNSAPGTMGMGQSTGVGAATPAAPRMPSAQPHPPAWPPVWPPKWPQPGFLQPGQAVSNPNITG